jgi:hypothetical protein
VLGADLVPHVALGDLRQVASEPSVVSCAHSSIIHSESSCRWSSKKVSLPHARLLEAALAEVVAAPLTSTAVNSSGYTLWMSGMSFSMSCSWSEIVWVEMTTRFLCFTAKSMAGSRYANDLPTPVPASTSR